MKLCGMSQKTIADKLNEQGILSPLQYKKSIGVPLESSFRKSIKPKWTYNTVLRILKNEVFNANMKAPDRRLLHLQSGARYF